MKQKNTLLLTGLMALAALAPLSAQAHDPRYHDGVRLATDIVNLIGTSLYWTSRVIDTRPPVVIRTAPIVAPAPVIIQEPVVILPPPPPVYVPVRPRYMPPPPRYIPPRPRFEPPRRGPHHARPMMPYGGRPGRGGW